MKKFLVLCSAVALFTLLGATTAAAQTSSTADTEYPPGTPVHGGPTADGSVLLDFSGTTLLPGQDITANVMGTPVVITIDENGVGTYPATSDDVPSLEGQAVTFTGQVEADPNGDPQTLVEKAFNPVVVPTAVPPVTVIQVVEQPDFGDPATTMVTTKITTPKNLPKAPAAQAAGPSVPLAITGAETSVPVMIGSGLILVGGLAIAASRRRAQDI